MYHKLMSGYLFNRMQLPVKFYVLNGMAIIQCRLFNPWWFLFHLICDEWQPGMVAWGWQSKNKGEIAPWPLQAVFNCNMPLNLHHHRVALHDSVFNWIFPQVEWGLVLHRHSSIVWWLLLVMSTKLKIFQHPHAQASLLWLWSKSGEVHRRTAYRRHGTMLTTLVWMRWLGRSLHRHDSIPFPVHRIQRCMRLLFSCSVVSNSFAIPWTVAHQVPLSMGFSRQEHWSVLPFPSPGDLPDPGIEHSDPCLLHWQEDSLWLSYQGSSKKVYEVDRFYY